MSLWSFKEGYVLLLFSPGFFRRDFITEDLLDIHEIPFEKAKQKRKRLFFTAGICKCTVVIQTENMELANV